MPKVPDSLKEVKSPPTENLIDEPDLIAAIRRDIAAVGLVGEEDNGLLVYTAYTSRLLEEPTAIITRGPSGSGKTTLLRRVAVLFPREVKIEAMKFTDASLFNTDEDHFKHKVFLSGERKHSTDDAARDAGAMMRQLLSEKRINRKVSIPDPKSPTGWTSVPIEREGPVAYAESTTSKSIFEEDLNRMLQLYADDSEAQNRKVMRAIASKYDPDHLSAETDVAATIKRHHDFQLHLQALPMIRVGIPYHKALPALMPAGNTKARRAIQQVFTVIESLVLLLQDRREKRNGFRLATLDDSAVAQSLLIGPLHAALGVGQDYKNAKRLKAAIKKTEFTTPEVKQALKFNNDMTTSNFLNGLVKAGLLYQLEEGKMGSPAKYQCTTGGQLKLETMVLPTVDQVEKFLNS